MRDMKFRQRNKNNGRFHYWGAIDGAWVMPQMTDNYVRPELSDQFIGYLDKIGTEVYERDILDFDEREWGGRQIEVVPDMFTLMKKGIGGTLSDIPQWRQVIGNIHEHPELLEPSTKEVG